MTTIAEFEDAVWRHEGIRIVIRAGSSIRVLAYNYERRAPRKKTIGWFISTRLRYFIRGETEVMVIDGGGNPVRGNVLVETVRDSYSEC